MLRLCIFIKSLQEIERSLQYEFLLELCLFSCVCKNRKLLCTMAYIAFFTFISQIPELYLFSLSSKQNSDCRTFFLRIPAVNAKCRGKLRYVRRYFGYFVGEISHVDPWSLAPTSFYRAFVYCACYVYFVLLSTGITILGTDRTDLCLVSYGTYVCVG